MKQIIDKNINIREHLHLLDTVEGLNKVGNLIALKYWGTELDIPIVINKRLTRTYGRFLYKYVRDHNQKVIGNIPDSIEVSSRSFNNFTKYAMLDLLKHEICHWACMKLGKSTSDGSKFFESEINRINATSTGVNMMKKGYKDVDKNRKKKK